MSLKGKIALITGGSRGIGRAITLKLATEGADVIINYFRKRSAAELTAQEACDRGVKAHTIKANLGDPEKIDSMFDEIETRFGRLDILINNAATGVARSALELDDRGWDWTIDVNARAFLLCAQRATKLMKNGKPCALAKVIPIVSLIIRDYFTSLKSFSHLPARIFGTIPWLWNPLSSTTKMFHFCR